MLISVVIDRNRVVQLDIARHGRVHVDIVELRTAARPDDHTVGVRIPRCHTVSEVKLFRGCVPPLARDKYLSLGQSGEHIGPRRRTQEGGMYVF